MNLLSLLAGLTEISGVSFKEKRDENVLHKLPPLKNTLLPDQGPGSVIRFSKVTHMTIKQHLGLEARS